MSEYSRAAPVRIEKNKCNNTLLPCWPDTAVLRLDTEDGGGQAYLVTSGQGLTLQNLEPGVYTIACQGGDPNASYAYSLNPSIGADNVNQIDFTGSTTQTQPLGGVYYVRGDEIRGFGIKDSKRNITIFADPAGSDLVLFINKLPKACDGTP